MSFVLWQIFLKKSDVRLGSEWGRVIVVFLQMVPKESVLSLRREQRDRSSLVFGSILPKESDVRLGNEYLTRLRAVFWQIF